MKRIYPNLERYLCLEYLNDVFSDVYYFPGKRSTKNQKDERNSIATMFCGARKTGKFQFPINILSEIIYRHIYI